MLKAKILLVSLLTSTILALVPNFISDLLSSWIDPGNNLTIRAILLLLLVALFLVTFLLQRQVDEQKPPNLPNSSINGGPTNPPYFGWTEAVSTVTLVTAATLVLCWSLESTSSEQSRTAFWLVPIGIAAGTLLTNWPIERKNRYSVFTQLLWRSLSANGVISFSEISKQYLSTTSLDFSTRQTREREIKPFISWFIFENKELGVRLENGQIILRSPLGRRDRYNDLSRWIKQRLQETSIITAKEVFEYFSSKVQFRELTPLQQEQEVMLFLRWFAFENEELGIRYENGRITWTDHS